MANLLGPIDTSGREGVSIEISRQLLDYLLSGRLQPGQRLPPERKLAEMFGVGRSVVREALKSITLLGLLEVRGGDGTYVKRTEAGVLPQTIEWGLVIGTRHVPDLVEAWRHLEVIQAGLAAERRDAASLDALHELMSGAAALEGDAIGAWVAQVGILRAISDAADNEVLGAAIATIRSLLQVWLVRLPSSEARAEASLAVLASVIKAIEGGDASGARDAVATYITTATEGIEQVVAAPGAIGVATPTA
jgi:GntR family transcriptional regulator, transcriptional repressor for pyruvate dehydrogenase complex